jgi:hypothetical protein
MSKDRRTPARPRQYRISGAVLRAPLWWIPVLFTLCWAMYAVIRRPVGDYAVETDFFGDYVPWSREWMVGHPSAMNGFKGPVYYLLLGLCSRLVTAIAPGGYPPPPGVEFAIGKALSVISAGLVLVLAGKIALKLPLNFAGRPTSELGPPALLRVAFPALLAQVVIATNVDFVDHSYRAATDLVSLALTIAAIWQGLPFDSSWLDLLRADAGRTVNVWLRNLPAHLRYDLAGLLGWPVALLALGGWASALLRSANRRRWVLLASFLILHSLVNVPIFYGKRFALPMLPFYALGVSGLACVLPARLASRRWVTVALPCLAALCFLGGQVRGLVLAENPDRFYQPREILVLRNILAQKGVRLDPAASLASRKPHAAYWLGVQATGLPGGDVLSTILDELRRRDARYLYVGSSEIVQRPALEPLANPALLRQRIDGLSRLGAGLYHMGGRTMPGVLYEVERCGAPDSAMAVPEVAERPVPDGVSRRDFVRFSLGRFYLQQGAIKAAAPLLERAAHSAPSWRAAQEWAGDAALFGRDAESAESYYRAALRVDAAAPTTASRIAALRMFQDRPAEVAEMLQRVLESSRGPRSQEPGSSGALGEVGRRYYAEGEYGTAWAPLMGAVMADSTDWRSQTDLGFIARNVLSDPGLGKNHLRVALRHMPPGPERNRVESILRAEG